MKFKLAENVHQQGTIIDHNLDPKELDLVERIVNFSDSSVARTIYDAAGRSVFVKSPSRSYQARHFIDGQFDALQIIGAGGNSIYVSTPSGVTSKQILDINPVDPENHASELSHILQEKEFTEEGLETRTREFASLHGMEKKFAEQRKESTQLLHDIINMYEKEFGNRTIIVPPVLAAEGIFEELLDDKGDPLHFQVYRVPRVPRFSGQNLKHFEKFKLKKARTLSNEMFMQLGRTLRSFHEFDIAYTAPHLDNFSILKHQKRVRTYCTDLGGLRSLQKEPFAEKYKILDLYIAVATTKQCFDNMHNYSKSIGKASSPRQFYELTINAMQNLIFGYFGNEVMEGKTQKVVSSIDFNQFFHSLYQNINDYKTSMNMLEGLTFTYQSEMQSISRDEFKIPKSF